MSEFEKWWESGSSPRQGKASARDGWNARDPEVAELKRQLAEIGELLKTASRQYSTVLQSNNDLRRQLSEARDAALVEADKREEIHSKLNQLREAVSPGRLAEQEYYIKVAQKMRSREDSIHGHLLRKGKEKGQ